MDSRRSVVFFDENCSTPLEEDASLTDSTDKINISAIRKKLENLLDDRKLHREIDSFDIFLDEESLYED